MVQGLGLMRNTPSVLATWAHGGSQWFGSSWVDGSFELKRHKGFKDFSSGRLINHSNPNAQPIFSCDDPEFERLMFSM